MAIHCNLRNLVDLKAELHETQLLFLLEMYRYKNLSVLDIDAYFWVLILDNLFKIVLQCK